MKTQGAIDTIDREIKELTRLVEIWRVDPQDLPNKKMFNYYEDLLAQHNLAKARLERV